MAGIHEIPPRFRTVRLGLLPLVRADELFLLGRIGFPKEAGGLVIADVNAMSQVSYSPRAVVDVEGLVDPVGYLLGGEKAPGGNLGLEPLDLGCSEFPGTAMVLKCTQRFQALGAVEPEPRADLSLGHAQEISDLVLSLAVGDPQDSGEAVGDPFIVSLTPTAFDLLADVRFQNHSWCHSFPRTT
jgi:hypothetical protein